MAMMMLNRNVMGNAAAVGAAGRRLLRQAREDVSSLLLIVGFVTCVRVVINLGVGASLLVAFFGGLGTMWAALWVADDAARRRATGCYILGASMAPLAIAFGVFGSVSVSAATTPTASTSFAL